MPHIINQINNLCKKILNKYQKYIPLKKYTIKKNTIVKNHHYAPNLSKSIKQTSFAQTSQHMQTDIKFAPKPQFHICQIFEGIH